MVSVMVNCIMTWSQSGILLVPNVHGSCKIEPVFCIFSRRTLQHSAAVVVCGSPMSASHRFSPWPCNQKHAAGHTVTGAALWWTLPPPSLAATINKPLHFWVKRASALISSSRRSFPPPNPGGKSLVPKLLSCADSPQSLCLALKSFSA